jgi:hypothetical protein
MAFDPLTPAPRLPENLTVTVGFGPFGPGNLRAMFTQSPTGDCTHISLIETLTPTRWDSPASLARVFHQPVEYLHPTQADAETATEVVLAAIGVPDPRRP